jgi:hypothetical protein
VPDRLLIGGVKSRSRLLFREELRMAFAVNARVKIADQSSEYRKRSGTVLSVVGDKHQVRVDGFGQGQTAELLTPQLRTEPLAAPYDYSQV